MGAAVNLRCLTNSSEAIYAQTHALQFNAATPENECKWAATQPQPGVFAFDECDSVKAASAASGAAFRLHNLAWGQYNPDWVMKANFTEDSARAALAAHISALVQRYSAQGGVYAIDVVNEPFSDIPGLILKPSLPWYPLIPDYVDFAFKTAKAAVAMAQSRSDPSLNNPKPLLFLNEYLAEAAGSAKSDALYNWVAAALKRGVPIDGIGLQMHIDTRAPPQLAALAANIRRLGQLGLQVHITEMDVRCQPPCDLNLQADIYAGIAAECLKQSSVCSAFTTWGFTDLHTWLWTYLNPQHVNMMPLLYDVNYTPKPAYASLLRSIQNASQA